MNESDSGGSLPSALGLYPPLKLHRLSTRRGASTARTGRGPARTLRSTNKSGCRPPASSLSSLIVSGGHLLARELGHPRVRGEWVRDGERVTLGQDAHVLAEGAHRRQHHTQRVARAPRPANRGDLAQDLLYFR
eukprot:scaffold133363_cov26-Tisochrysis_lutea.AAC.5